MTRTANAPMLMSDDDFNRLPFAVKSCEVKLLVRSAASPDGILAEGTVVLVSAKGIRFRFRWTTTGMDRELFGPVAYPSYRLSGVTLVNADKQPLSAAEQELLLDFVTVNTDWVSVAQDHVAVARLSRLGE